MSSKSAALQTMASFASGKTGNLLPRFRMMRWPTRPRSISGRCCRPNRLFLHGSTTTASSMAANPLLVKASSPPVRIAITF